MKFYSYKEYAAFVNEQWEMGAINELVEDGLIKEAFRLEKTSRSPETVEHRKLTGLEFLTSKFYMQLLQKANGNLPRSEEDKKIMIEEAAHHYGQFLTALGFDWKADPHSDNTPTRVAKAWVHDLAKGSMSAEPKITTFPNDEGYTGLICQTRIPVTSLCAHHNLPFFGSCHVAYIAGKSKEDRVIGLSKLNRIVEFFSCRPNIQESLTKQIHDHIDKLCIGNRGVAVVIETQHCCVKCRGIRNDSVMKTSQMSGYFHTNEIGTRAEFFNLIDQSRVNI